MDPEGPPPEVPPAAPEPPAAAAPAPALPPVPWGPPSARAAITGVGQYQSGRPRFTVGALLSDTFARYGADPFRLYVVAAIGSLITYLLLAFSNPYDLRSSGGSGVWSLLSTVISFALLSTTLALLEAGPTVPLWRAVRRGLQRTGWVLLTLLLLALGFLVAAIVAAIAITIAFFVAPAAAVVVVFVLFLLALWAVLRLYLALPATVVDGLGPIEALRLSWRITRPAGVWLRLVASLLLLGLCIGPAEAGAVTLQFAIYAQQPQLLVPAALILAAVTPLLPSLIYSAYRRLVPPFWPPWVGVPATSGEIPPPSFDPPRFGTGALAIVVVVIVLAVAGLAIASYELGEITAGRLKLPFPAFPGSSGYPGYPGFTFPPFPTFGP